VNSLCCVLCLFLDLCVCVVAATVVLACVSIPTSPCGFIVINLVRVRGSNLWRFLTKGINLRQREPWYSSGSLDHLKGVECNPRPLGCHNVD
jgi:hypothetical protein